MTESFFPYYKNGEIKDGIFSKCPKYCKNRLKKSKESCVEFHNNFIERDVIKICPDGFASYNTNEISYTALLFHNDNSQKIIKKVDSERDIPIITQDAFDFFIKNQYNNIAIENALRDTLHDVKKLNGFILDLLSQLQETSEVYAIIEPIHKWSMLTKAKLTLYDLTMNGLLLNQGKPVPKHPFKMFDAIKKSFESISSEKNLQFYLHTKDRFDFNVLLFDSFQLVPFILLDNAMKYSPNNERILISFSYDQNEDVVIETKSIGPKPTVSDLNLLFQKGFRDKSVLNKNIQGSGLGLSIAKDICKLNDVEISIRIEELEYRQQMLYPEYTVFCVIIRISKSKIIRDTSKRKLK